MKIWAYWFEGRFPVGACGVVVAEDEDIARLEARDHLKAQGFEGTITRIDEITLEHRHARILLNGDY